MAKKKTQTFIVRIIDSSEKVTKDQVKEAIEYHLADVTTPRFTFQEIKVLNATASAVRKLGDEQT